MANWQPMSDEEFARQNDAAVERGQAAMAREARAKSVKYDYATHSVSIVLQNWATLSVPCHLVQGLREAAPQDIADVKLGPRNAHLWWDKLDVQFTVDAFIEGRFGTKKWLAQLAVEEAALVEVPKKKSERLKAA